MLMGGIMRTRRADGVQDSAAIDVHTHIFNCRFLPINGIFKMWFHRVGIPGENAEALAAILNAATDDCSGRIVRPFSRAVEDRIVETERAKELIDILWDQVPAEAFADARVQKVWPLLPAQGGLKNLDKAKFIALLYQAAKARPTELFGTALEFLRWIVLMTRCEARIFAALRRTYPKVSLFVHHTMDMDHWYEDWKGLSHYDFVTQQLPRMRIVVEASGGTLLTFAAFDPKREEWETVLDTALANGCVGAKFYPANGYQPSGDPDPVVCERTKKFFEKCAAGRVPVFTHCTPIGFQAYEDSGLLADPLYWRPVLKDNPTLRLCFGHAGGAMYWFNQPGECGYKYGEAVIDLCRTYANVYCEVGYHDEILASKGPDRFRAVLEGVINTPTTSEKPYNMADKMMYGSDWHMIAKVRDHRRYVAAFAKVFDESRSPGLKDMRDKFFRDNALRFLKLAPTRPSRPRRSAKIRGT
jgi:predicted TIM-barrel fold metal-dependent hydrolase